jgi:preprotein translocase subunit SecA
MANRNREVGASASSGNSVVETIVREQRKIGRNERVKIKNIQTGEVKQVKYKQAEPLIQTGTWILNEN